MSIVYPSLSRHVSECAVTIIVIKNVVAEIRDVQIEKAVIIVVSSGYAHAIPNMSHAGLFSDINEAQFARFCQQILEEPVPWLPARWRGRQEFSSVVQPRALHQIDIEIAIVVIIEQSHSRTHNLGHVVAACGKVEMAEIEPDLGRHVPEGRRRVRPDGRDAEAERGERFQKITAAQRASSSAP